MALSFLNHRKLPETVGTLFDVDTPSDLAVLELHPAVGSNVKGVLQKMDLEPASSRLRKVREVMSIPLSEVCLIGRVNPQTVSYVNERLQCRTRVFSEERGMKALGREGSRQIVSLLGYLTEEVGFTGLVRALEKVADAVLWIPESCSITLIWTCLPKTGLTQIFCVRMLSMILLPASLQLVSCHRRFLLFPAGTHWCQAGSG